MVKLYLKTPTAADEEMNTYNMSASHLETLRHMQNIFHIFDIWKLETHPYDAHVEQGVLWRCSSSSEHRKGEF